MTSVITAIVMEETASYSLIEVCDKYHIPKELLLEMIEEGLFSHKPSDIQHLTLVQRDLQRIESALRLHRDLGVNLAGVALALDLLDELDKLRRELGVLRRQI